MGLIGPWGRRAAGPEAPPPASPESRLACEQCGAILTYAPGTTELVCEYCGHRNPIAERPVEIVEHDLRAALERGLAEAPTEEARVAKCASCGAGFAFEGARHAGACPFCGHAVVTDTGAIRRIRPAALLPFAIEERSARERVRAWLHGLWLAPSRLAEFARTEGRLTGIYLPHWTFDSRVVADYRGQRGTVYMVPMQVRTVVNGRPVTQTCMVQRVRWRPVRGRVSRFFDDVLVLASRSLPAWLTDRLEPWDLGALRPYAREFLAGFESEAYHVPLDEGFARAGQKMRAAIQADVRADIGGDLQRIDHLELRHHDTTFKHVLLPVWLGAFRYGGKTYRLCVNGRTGQVQGERPYSAWKVALAVLVAVIALLLALYLGAGADLDLGSF